jgi:hypothetical protein
MNNEIMENNLWDKVVWKAEWIWISLSEKLYETLETCIDSFAINDKNLDFVVHELEIGEEVEPDIHDIDERVVANNGKFEIVINNEKYFYDASKTKGYVVFHIPSKTLHSLKTIEKTKYYVFKGKE